MLRGKTALITGGSRGIGRAVALEMARAGADIGILYAGRRDAAEEVCREARTLGVRAECRQCDVSDAGQAGEAVRWFLEAFGKADILVNNAGITADRLLVQMSEEDFDRVMSVNLKGAFLMTKFVYSHMARRRAGRIINVTSVSGLHGNPGQANYAAAKAGLIGLTKTTAKELAGRGVTCNAVAPGFIATEMTDAMPAAAKERVLEAVPMKKMGTPQDVAGLTVFLASDLAGYITGP